MSATTTGPPRHQRAPWRRWAIGGLGVYVLGAVVFLALGGGQPDDFGSGRDEALGRVHAIEYETLDGEPTSFAQYAGQPLVINFFASWCGPCIEEMPDFEAFHRNFGDTVTVVGLAVEGARPARQLVEEVGVTYDTGLDQRDIVVELGGVGMPTTVFVSPAGEILESHTGVLTYEDMVAKSEKYFGEASES